MSAVGVPADVIYQQLLCANGIHSGQISTREINMRGLKWTVKFDFKQPSLEMEIVVTLKENSDIVKFPLPIYAEFLFYDKNSTSTYNIIRYQKRFNLGQSSDRLLMPPLAFSPMTIECKLKLYPRYHRALNTPITVSKHNLVEGLSNFLHNEKFSDVSIVVQGRIIKAHKVVLSSASPVFLALLDNNQENKIEMDDIDHETMVQVVTNIYTGKALDLENCVEKVLFAADRFQLDWLKSECEDFLMNKIDEENACDLMIKGYLYNAKQLQEGAKAFITENFTDVKKTEGFRKLGETHLHLLLEILQCCDLVSVRAPFNGRALKLTVDNTVNI